MTRHKFAAAFCVAFLMAFLSAFQYASTGECGAEETPKIDFTATQKYVKDWAARQSFPDSPSFAYQNAYCQLALEGQISDTDKKRIVEFLRKSQKPDGGFVSSPDLIGEPSNVIFTYFALATLDLIDSASSVDRDKATSFILSLMQKDGSIKGTSEDANANLGTTCYGVRSLGLLKALDRLDKNRTSDYINSHRDDSRGFGVLPGKPSAVQATSMAVDSLRLLGKLTDQIKPGVMEYIRETPYSGLKEPENLALMSMDDMAHALETADILSSMQQMNAEKIYRFVESLYIPQNGGFGPSPGLGTTPPSTYYAIVCLVKLGKLKDPYSMAH